LQTWVAAEKQYQCRISRKHDSLPKKFGMKLSQPVWPRSCRGMLA